MPCFDVARNHSGEIGKTDRLGLLQAIDIALSLLCSAMHQRSLGAHLELIRQMAERKAIRPRLAKYSGDSALARAKSVEAGIAAA